MTDDKKIEMVKDVADEAGEEGEITTTANEVNLREMVKALQKDISHMEDYQEALEARITAMNDISRMNVASNVLPYYLGSCEGDTDMAIEFAWDVAEDFVAVFDNVLEQRQQEMVGLLKEQDTADDGETVN